jgi:acyl-CoA synthetase (AMP-forming)/AMP-acid ligase II
MNSSLGVPKVSSDVELLNLPLFGIGFIQQSLPTLLAGGAVVLDRIFDPARAWDLLERHRATFTFLAPTMIAAMLGVEGHDARDVSALRTIGVAYEFAERLRTAALARFGDIFVNMYGLTEAQLTCTRLGEFAADPTSVGKPMGLARIAILDEAGESVERGAVGEICFDAPTIMSGYHAKVEETAESLREGWVHTGDLGYLDERGNLHFAGRRKEIIKTGGFSVDPVEIENVILELEWVLEAAVVGAPDEHWGEAVIAVVVCSGGAEVQSDEVIALCKSRLAGFKVPKRVISLAELPKNPTGKIERGRLRELVK